MFQKVLSGSSVECGMEGNITGGNEKYDKITGEKRSRKEGEDKCKRMHVRDAHCSIVYDSRKLVSKSLVQLYNSIL